MAISHLDKGNTGHSGSTIADPTEVTHLETGTMLDSTLRYISNEISHVIRLTVEKKCNNETCKNKSRRQFEAQ